MLSKATGSSGPSVKRRRDVLAECSDLSGTKIGAVRVIQRLHERGLLTDDALVDGLTSETLRRDARIGTEDAVANAHTPHGPVVTTLNVNGTDIEVVNPFAYVYFLCERNPDLFEILMPAGAVVQAHRVVRRRDPARQPTSPRQVKDHTMCLLDLCGHAGQVPVRCRLLVSRDNGSQQHCREDPW